MRANAWEFHYRFLIICGIFTAAFCCYFIDRVNASVALLRALAPGLALDSPRGHRALSAVLLFAAALACAAAWLRSWASAYLRSEIVHDTAVHAEALVADGPYRYVRNPLYLGNVFLGLSMALLASRLGAAVVVVGQMFFLLRLIGYEEAALCASEPERFAAYSTAVPRLLPALRPRLPPGGRNPRWLQGVVGEAFTWIVAASVAVFALTLDGRFVPVTIGIGFVIYWILFAFWRRRLARTG